MVNRGIKSRNTDLFEEQNTFSVNWSTKMKSIWYIENLAHVYTTAWIALNGIRKI